MENMEHRFHPSIHVYTAAVDNQIVILDLQHDTFLGLNQTAATMWKMFTIGKTLLEVALICSKDDTINPRILSDVTMFVENMRSKQLLVLSDHNEPGSDTNLDQAQGSRSLQTFPFFFQIAHHLCRRGPGDFMEAYIILFQIQHVLQREGFLRLVEDMNKQPAHKNVTAEDEEVKHLVRAVKVAADWHRFPAVCLHQSMALCWILRRRAIQADVVIGVYTHPFSAHVWVCCNEHILQWEAGMGAYPDPTRLAAMSVVFHSGRMIPAEGKIP